MMPLLQAGGYTDGYCALVDSTDTTTVAATPEKPSSPSVAVAASLRYTYILEISPKCSAIRLLQTEIYENEAIGGGVSSGTGQWLISCSDTEEAFGKL